MEAKLTAILGCGVSGLAAAKLLSKQSGHEIVMINNGEVKEWTHFNAISSLIGVDNCLSEKAVGSILEKVTEVIISPGISREHSFIQQALNRKISVISEIELAYRYLDHTNQIIGITGTNGKTTTVTLVTELLNCYEKAVYACGNIGEALCEVVSEKNPKNARIIVELSSFQLESIEQFCPEIACILNITPHHGERYSDVNLYEKAKFNIAKNMDSSGKLLVNKMLKSSKFIDQKVDEIVWVSGNDIADIVDLDRLQLRGDHNIENLAFALSIVKLLGEDVQICLDTAYKFKGLEHRIEKVDSKNSFCIFNDSKSTNFESTCSAIEAVHKMNDTLWVILGGKLRGNNDSIGPYLSRIKSKVSKVLLYGESNISLSQELEGNIDFNCFESLSSLKTFVENNLSGGTLLFSPAFPSFDSYENYKQRGQAFKKEFES